MNGNIWGSGIVACSVVTALLKRLVRKTQECEELKEKIKQVKDFRDKVINQLKDENGRYRKALEEIEEYCQQNRQAGWVDIEGILDIISKAKENK